MFPHQQSYEDDTMLFLSLRLWIPFIFKVNLIAFMFHSLMLKHYSVKMEVMTETLLQSADR